MVNVIKISVVDGISKKLERMKKEIERVQNLSVEDATRFCWLNWKTKIPFKTGISMRNISYVVKPNHGMVFSPANNKGNFLLNLFLELGDINARKISPGSIKTSVKGRDYELKNGKIFGAGYVSAQETQPYFRGIIQDRMGAVIR